VKPQNGICYFSEGASGSLRQGNLRKTDLTAAGYDQDRSFMLVEIAGDELRFQTISRIDRPGSVNRNVTRSLGNEGQPVPDFQAPEEVLAMVGYT
jgi:hypothetical protein